MIYLCAENPSQKAAIEMAMKHWNFLRSQVQFILGPQADDILRVTSGLESFEYLFSAEPSLFNRIVDLRFEIEPNSVFITDLEMTVARIYQFQEAIQEIPMKTDFYRLLHIDRLEGAFFMTKLGYNRIWSITPGNRVTETHFRWVHLDPDSCLNMAQERPENLAKGE